MALTGKVMGTSDRTKVRFFRAAEAERVFGTTDPGEIHKTVMQSAMTLTDRPRAILVNGLHYGILISWY